MLISSVILIAGVLIGKSSYRTGLPLLLIFLFVGMAFGVDGLGISFNNMHAAQFVGMIALCVILFSGGMSTSIRSIRPIVSPGLVLSTAGVLITALLTGIFIFWLSGMSWTNIHFALIPSFLLAATMSSTDSASVFGILGSRNVGLKYNLRPMLELESGSNDPMAYMLTIILIKVATIGSELSAGNIIVQLIMQFAVGGVSGLIIGYAGVKLAKFYKHLGGNSVIEDTGQTTAMISILVIGSAFLTFALATALGGNGYLAVYIAGIVFGNSQFPFRKGVAKFMDGITWIAQIVVFIMLGLLVNPHEMLSVAAVSILIGLFIMTVGRPISVFLCLAPFNKINLRSKLFVSWVGLRGAVPIIFATYPVVADVSGASQIFNIVFFVTILSLVVQGTSVISSARKLRLIDDSAETDDPFGVELTDDSLANLRTIELTKDELTLGATIKDLKLPEGSLVMLVLRNGRYIVPNGKRRLHEGDKLLIIEESSALAGEEIADK